MILEFPERDGSNLIQWQCPFCGHYAMVNPSRGVHELTLSDHSSDALVTRAIRCMNSTCAELELTAELMMGPGIIPRGISLLGWLDTSGKSLQRWTLRPRSHAKQFPTYIPEAIRQDYEEACAIVELSPKASATLSRRCLQGMIRDFHGVTGKPNLKQEIEAIKGKIDATIREAVDNVRKIGNIGAHMEQDVNLVIDVEPKEAQLLIKLNEVLFKDWYISREERRQMLESVADAGKSKEAAKKGGYERPAL